MKFSISALLTLSIILIFLSSCGSKKGENLNTIPEKEFSELLINEVSKLKPNKVRTAQYLDSLFALPGLDNLHKSQVALLRAVSYLHDSKLDSVAEKAKFCIKVNKSKVNYVLISAYYLLGTVQESKNKIYEARYYKNKAGEMLKKYDIYNTLPAKADTLLIQIAFSNKYFDQIDIANSFADAAIKKHNQYSKNSKDLALHYIVKAFMFSARDNINKDSMNFYINKSLEAVGNDTTQNQKENIMYIKAEFYFNSHQVDSALFYMKQISPVPENEIVYRINLLSIYSQLKQHKKADEELDFLQKKVEKGEFNASDTLTYLNNLIDYHFSRKDYKQTQEAINNFLNFHASFYNKEAQKNVNELSSLIDLQQKEEELLEVKNEHGKEVQSRNLIIIIIVSLLIIALFTIAYIKMRFDKRKLIMDNQSVNLQLRLLQTQINPHFIFNTLGSIRSLIRQNENEMSAKYLSTFSLLLRQILDLSRNTEITLDKEINLLKAYVEMQKLRKNNFDIQINISEEVEEIQQDIYLPALILQPFVENSIIHGFKDINYKGNIVINIEDKIQYLHISISDNGCGLKNDNNEKKRKSHGIDIIKEHLLIIGKSTGKPASLEISNQTDKPGTIVKLKIPIGAK